MKLDQFLWMSEAEGITENTSTRQTRLNAAIKDFILAARAGLNIDNEDIQAVIFEDYGLEDISTKEANKIAEKVRKALYKN